MRVLASLLLLLSAGLKAQDFAQVFGVIRDSSEAVVPGAVVTAMNQATGIRRTCRSNDEGVYIIASLQPGTYKLTVRKEGFQTIVRLGLRLEVAQTAQVDFVLQVGPTEQEITVDGGPAPVNLDDGSVGMVMGRKMIEALPQDGRNLVGLLELTPGVLVTPATSGEAGQFTANGQRANANYFTLDGISANTGVSGTGIPAQFSSGSLPGMTALGSTHNLISIEALEEFRIATSSFAPEFGRLPGAQVIVTSRSGTNEFHGAAFESLRHEALAANDWFANAAGLRRGVLRYNNFGGVLGGPLRRNRTFFFASYEGLRLKQPLTWSAPVPSHDLRLQAPAAVQPILRAFPEPNGRSLGDGLAELTASAWRPSRLDTGSFRLDHSFSPRLNVFARYSRTPSETDSGYAQINHSVFLSESITAGMTAVIAPSLINELRVNTTNTTVDGEWVTTNEGGAVPLDLSRLPLPVAVPPEK
ncbi:MAG TPA: TonB-dependent receptor, partial [Bryobacteraceae bacterium]|nr:TonB-dependent receptor [Bryobacteraceae bacterium]